MKSSYKDGIIESNIEISENIYEIILNGDFQGFPGQFYMIRGWEALDPFLSRPISIADLNNGKITFLYEVKGRGTHIISKLKKGDKLSILGPLGNGFNINTKGKIALISGGIGIAPMLYLAKSLNINVDLYCGFRDKPYFLETIGQYVDNIFVATDNGVEGHKGFVTELFNPMEYDLVYTCGPTPMMKVVMNICKGKVPLYISMENRMACGIGACLGCTVETIRGIERVCKEGPVFKGEEITID
ncbi:dihydroorotate dehydrogenase electron transfer subunit [Tissierella pigra]|uniref:Dihydroorotate dehydrogenase B (NAD(+)), electron transfer subunit n=1 Tax=Tissierella pigra TaxID=2607614 RepID=A0A6N7XWP4_9FIRM|nr:dihydroorotate dehydrogenase electron transfer subunit [Tissierella pigra]MBU5427429.1 dihydroorotate dehydrogenase electron transfer subunit [Tissierella pigra]MSU00974.1 dihydroorotate dehydrogenase electron transfer subunit [Tissierella pigra]